MAAAHVEGSPICRLARVRQGATRVPRSARPRPRRAVLILAAAGLAPWLVGCRRNEPVGAPRGNAPREAAVRDLAITTEVQVRLARDARFAPLQIQVQTTAGRVLLRGMAPDTATRREIADIVRGVAGVVEVRNDLSVQWLKP